MPPEIDPAIQSFGARLRWWRERRGLSQLDLAGTIDSSQRHLSFLESGRTVPSRAMVLRLAAALDVPLRQQNALLLAAGYAPAWRQRDLAAPEMAKVDSALDFMLAQQEPYPAFVVDRHWTLLRANRGAACLTSFLLGPTPTPPPDAPPAAVNLAEALVSPAALRPLIANWPEVALYFVRSVQADAIADGTPETAELLRRLLAYPDMPRWAHTEPPEENATPVLAIHFRKGEVSLRLFTTIATLGTPLDVTAQEIRIEAFFPADGETADRFRIWAREVAPA
jgi:transcriptional regulator with XRE-family HTH domain